MLNIWNLVDGARLEMLSSQRSTSKASLNKRIYLNFIPPKFELHYIVQILTPPKKIETKPSKPKKKSNKPTNIKT